MKYPDDFNTPAFPAGKFIAVSRFMATAVMLLFFAIVCLCGVILWVKSTQSTSPFLVSIRPNGERWAMVEHTNHKTEIPAYYVMQEALLNKFAKDWFTINIDPVINQAVWSGNCKHNSVECLNSHIDQVDTCALYCASSNNVFESFKNVVLPVYSQITTQPNTQWIVREVFAAPVDTVYEDGGLWHLNIIVKTTNMGTLRFSAYALIEKDADTYKQNMGYYIANFNSYRMN